MHIIAHLFMQDPKNNSATSRKPWYQRAMEIASIWKITNPKSPEIPSSNPILNKNLSTSNKFTTTRNNTPNRQKLRKSTSLKVATSFTRVCLCVPISSYTDVFQADVPPRRSNTYPRSRPFPTCIQDRPAPRLSTGGGRRIFRGKSLTDDVLMRRFMIEEEAMMQERRRNEMEVIRKRNAKRRRKLGPSPLSRMVLAEEEDEF
ncbi:hypothetical protein L1987_33344 [Smallanthus sonchifolius]|uniref:Uncharacterized protein n=1 Tax=Smallanthus sonchifolius TaxID=185202 RepID=A0ACB9HQT0_9ASTR|nr:hypothetical protein L1987_33344 [Smallanthus sonchifolius]